MIEYTINDNLNVAFGGSDIKQVPDNQNCKSFKYQIGNNNQRLKLTDSRLNNESGKLIPVANIQSAFRALEQLMLHRQESKLLSSEIIKVYTEMLHVDGACIYKCTTEDDLELMAYNTTWSNILTMLQIADEVESLNILLNPLNLLRNPAGTNIWEVDQSSKIIHLSFGMRNYGSVISLPLVCDGTTVGVISLFSVHPQFFIPENIYILRIIAYLTASLYKNIYLKDILEKEQIERIALQKDAQILHQQIASHQHNSKTHIDVNAAADDELEALSYSISHDLHAPIRAIRNNCEWLDKQHASKLDTEGQKLLHQITASSEHMEKLLDGLLAFSKVVKPDPQQSLIDMTALVHSVIDELLKCECGSSSISITVQPSIACIW